MVPSSPPSSGGYPERCAAIAWSTPTQSCAGITGSRRRWTYASRPDRPRIDEVSPRSWCGWRERTGGRGIGGSRENCSNSATGHAPRRSDNPQGPPDSSGTRHTAMVIRDIGAQVLVSWRPSLGSCCPWQRIGSSTSPADSALAPTAQPRWVTAAMGDQQPCLRYRAGRELRRATGPAEQDQRTAAVRMRQCSRAT